MVKAGELRVPEAFLKTDQDGGVSDPETKAGIEGLLNTLAVAAGELGPVAEVV